MIADINGVNEIPTSGNAKYIIIICTKIGVFLIISTYIVAKILNTLYVLIFAKQTTIPNIKPTSNAISETFKVVIVASKYVV